MKIHLPVGEVATSFYYLESLDASAASVEELCFLIKENAYLLDGSFMSEELLLWLEKECDLKELAKELAPFIRRAGQLSGFVTLLLEYVGLYDATVIRQVEQVLKQNAGLSLLEKKKSQADRFLSAGKYSQALKSYDTLLALWLEGQAAGMAADQRTGSALYGGKAMALAHLMRYQEAAENFRLAYECFSTEQNYMRFLAAKRMELPQEEYVAFCAALEGGYEQTLKLERLIEKLQSFYTETPAAQRILSRTLEDVEATEAEKTRQNRAIVEGLKHTYRTLT